MRKFDYSFLNNGLLPANLVNLTANISSLKTMAGVRKDEYKQILLNLKLLQRYSLLKVLMLLKELLQATNVSLLL